MVDYQVINCHGGRRIRRVFARDIPTLHNKIALTNGINLCSLGHRICMYVQLGAIADSNYENVLIS